MARSATRRSPTYVVLVFATSSALLGCHSTGDRWVDTPGSVHGDSGSVDANLDADVEPGFDADPHELETSPDRDVDLSRDAELDDGVDDRPRHRDHVLFYDDCEDEWSEDDYRENGSSAYYPYNSITQSTERSRSGSGSYRFSLVADPSCGNNTCKHIQLVPIRSEVRRLEYDREYWIGYSILVPDDLSTLAPGYPNWLDTVDIHNSPDDCDTGLGQMDDILVVGTKMLMRIRSNTNACDTTEEFDRDIQRQFPYVAGEWNDIVWNFRLSFTPDGGGFFRVWMNGEQVVDDNGINAHNDERRPYWKFGLYGVPTARTTVFYDEIRVGDEEATYEDVAP